MAESAEFKPICVAATGDLCGEGVLWSAEDQAVYWVDNRRNLIHQYLPMNGSIRTWQFEETVAALALTVDPRRLCVVLGSRLLLWSPSTDERIPYAFRLHGWPALRFNDAGVAPNGDLWIGSMQNNILPDGSLCEISSIQGSLFRLSGTGVVTTAVGEIGIANTMAWSPNGRHFYSADTLTNSIVDYPYDLASGKIGEPRHFFAGFTHGLPDGSAMDSEGSLWNCRYGGSCVIRISTAGKVQKIIKLPVPNVTSCAFGGEFLRTLYITTAESSDRLTSPSNRGLFAISMKVPGQPLHRHYLADQQCQQGLKSSEIRL